MAKGKYLTPREYAKLRGVSLDLVYRELWVGRIKGAIKVGRTWRIPAREAPRIIEAGFVPAREEGR